MPTPAETLIARIERAIRWPPPGEGVMWGHLRLWKALRNSDRRTLALASGIDEPRYMIDPLPEKIAEAFADLVWPNDPVVVAQSDEELYDQIVMENAFGTKVKAATDQQVAEGSVWWRIYSDRDIALSPLLDFHSRSDLIPLFIAGQLRSVAFFSRLDDGTKRTAWRHLEVHEDGAVFNLLYRGTDTTIGKRQALTRHPDTAMLKEEWRHLLPMLAGWVPNGLPRGQGLAMSDYHPVADMLLELNESLATGKSNRRLTARKRVVVPAAALDASGQLDPEQEAIVDDPVDTGDGPAGANRFRVLEYSFDAEALIRYQNDLAVKALTRIGIAAQFIGVPTDDGFAQSGTAMRLRLIPSVNAAKGKAKPWDDEAPGILLLLARVANLGLEEGGFGYTLDSELIEPTIERGHPLPEDPVERTARLAQARTAGIVSTWEAVRQEHPDWTDYEDDEMADLDMDEPSQVSREVERIREDDGGGAGGGNTPTPGGVPNLFAASTATDRSAQGAASEPGAAGTPEAT